VPGSVLVVDGVAYFAAGRQSLDDGGILVFAVDPAAGKIRWVRRLDSVPQKGFYECSGLEFDNFDLLHREADGVGMSRWVFDRQSGDGNEKGTWFVLPSTARRVLRTKQTRSLFRSGTAKGRAGGHGRRDVGRPLGALAGRQAVGRRHRRRRARFAFLPDGRIFASGTVYAKPGDRHYMPRYRDSEPYRLDCAALVIERLPPGKPAKLAAED